MIKCPKCNNDEVFAEVHIGGYRRHQYTQEKSGRIVFDGSDYDRVDDTVFVCGKCNNDLNNQYRKFLGLLMAVYDEKLHGI